MKIVSFLGKLTISIFVAAIAIALFILLLVSMVATALKFGFDYNIHIAWTIPTILLVICALGSFIGKIYYELFA